MKDKTPDIAFKELHLNIRHQDIQVQDFSQIGYEFSRDFYVFVLMIPCDKFGFKLKERKT